MQTYALLYIGGGVLHDVEQCNDFDTLEAQAKTFVKWQEGDEPGSHDNDAHILSIQVTPTGISVDWIANY